MISLFSSSEHSIFARGSASDRAVTSSTCAAVPSSVRVNPSTPSQ
jgi:hypothetical protein